MSKLLRSRLINLYIYLKAAKISKTQSLNIVCRLGGFHTIVSFLGSVGRSVGYLMKGSGIADLFEENYASNSVQHILAGKAYARALRAHIMT